MGPSLNGHKKQTQQRKDIHYGLPDKTNYFEPSSQDFMINYRVENMEALVEELKKEGVTVLDQIETYDYGKFVHILDIEDNKIELWEANDEE
ncbi:hypothetical protein GCM10023231_21010 [Olivibacter ginsenosidimutans]|uniref:VOC domain-containing protein n=1 Tax=Olivibacter ginsenosidimutans TaxID=1176537 RepID=A0ABP9B9X8_9SPHI